MKKTFSISIFLSVLAWLWAKTLIGAGHDITPPIYSVIPFAGILLSIAVIPLINGHWWHHNFPKVSLLFGLPMATWALTVNWHWFYHTGIEYIAFIILLGALFTISGGILIKGHIYGSTMTNCSFLIIGALIASIIGTTGAAMLLIRPLIRANHFRVKKTHIVVFFIFIVANIGGSLTPLGDPPLFLGFLQGVDFFWTFKLVPEWAFACIILIIIFAIIDSILLKKENITAKTIINEEDKKIKIEGKINFIFLAGVLGAVILYSKLPDSFGLLGKNIVQVSIMLTMAILSLKFTPKKTRQNNGFTWFPIKEVAILFAAIFATMIPALKLLELRGTELGVTEPLQFFWATGLLSAFLDNAPTYLTFLSMSKAVTAELLINLPDMAVITLFDGSKVSELILVGISLGAVFMGAVTYIGNGPNFMVKSVAEEAGVKMPSFLGYMVWSVLILIPLFVVVSLVFL